ncbi:hypothetical protein FNQ90_01615 [Streptomyces alkaliphilus]|uniref:Polysaccharide pyruvyl transferase family protein n=1 Tax=Streptomyces alkaliphilus TaxID=1472722 RepID=A0A7W3TA70_9ACTN|nr:polysaccharide pyruvyl transferase family protein [Streptomyces alkaliphilus]MBB0242835.1 hypothetical protein [Streptomyces alkaliphilus]
MADSELATWNWRSETSGKTNFGDELGPLILERLGHRVRTVALEDAEIVTVGSVLRVVCEKGRDGLIVWGTGLTRDSRLPRRDFRVHAVRGRRSAAALGLGDVTLGDPGMLVSHLWKRPPIKYRVGVVPHYLDHRGFSWADKVIDVSRPVDEVLEEIGSCATIATSSLHGMIVAQSWEIPVCRIPHGKVPGGDFKWADHITSLDRPVARVQSDLLDALDKALA